MRSLVYLEVTKLTCQHFVDASRRQETPESDKGLWTASEKDHLAAAQCATPLGRDPNVIR